MNRASLNIPANVRQAWKAYDQRLQQLRLENNMARAIVSWDTLDNAGWKMEDVEVRKPGDGELLVEMVGSTYAQSIA